MPRGGEYESRGELIRSGKRMRIATTAVTDVLSFGKLRTGYFIHINKVQHIHKLRGQQFKASS